MNSACFFLLLIQIHQLKRPKGLSNLPLENFFESFILLRFAAFAIRRAIQIVKARNPSVCIFYLNHPSFDPYRGLKPGWARGRMNATAIMASQGAMALGGVIWGSSTSMWGVTSTLLASCSRRARCFNSGYQSTSPGSSILSRFPWPDIPQANSHPGSA